jgi:hypothetical protein
MDANGLMVNGLIEGIANMEQGKQDQCFRHLRDDIDRHDLREL